MTIRLSPTHRLKPLFDRHHVAWLSEEAAERQDIRPLQIGILNIMPQAEEYEFNLLAPMGRSILQIIPIWIRLREHTYTSSDQDHLNKHYLPYDWAQSVAALDGLIVTGAPVEELPWEQITYWEELRGILSVAQAAGTCILGICWGGLALAKYLGLEKIIYPQKILGSTQLATSCRTIRSWAGWMMCSGARRAAIPAWPMPCSKQLNRRGNSVCWLMPTRAVTPYLKPRTTSF